MILFLLPALDIAKLLMASLGLRFRIPWAPNLSSNLSSKGKMPLIFHHFMGYEDIVSAGFTKSNELRGDLQLSPAMPFWPHDKSSHINDASLSLRLYIRLKR